MSVKFAYSVRQLLKKYSVLHNCWVCCSFSQLVLFFRFIQQFCVVDFLFFSSDFDQAIELPLIKLFLHELLIISFSSQNSGEYTGDGSVSYRGHPVLKHNTGNWRACSLILGNLTKLFIWEQIDHVVFMDETHLYLIVSE